MTATILVTGGTGTLGRHVVRRLSEAHRDVRVLSRGNLPYEEAEGVQYVTGDLSTGEGIAEALDGIETVVHLAGSSKGDDLKTQHLVEAAAPAPVRHLVYISVVGADRIPVESGLDRAMFGYFEAKLASERIVADSGIPFTILRATQFHELFQTTARQMAKMPVIPAPSGFRLQTIGADEVAARLVELALGEPAGRVPDLAGPDVFSFKDMLHSYLESTDRHRLIVPLRMPGKAARAFREGANLAPDRAVGQETWQEFLATHAA